MRDGGRTDDATRASVPPPMRRGEVRGALGGTMMTRSDWRSASAKRATADAELEAASEGVRARERGRSYAREADRDGWVVVVGGDGVDDAKLRALTKEAALFRDESRARTQTKRGGGRERGASEEEWQSVKREHAALKFSHDKLKTTNEEADEESKRRTRALKKKLPRRSNANRGKEGDRSQLCARR
jgi:hypothetical protein